MPKSDFMAEPLSRLGPPWDSLSRRAREVLEALEDIYLAEGFAALTLTDLTVRLRCSRRTLYELAPDRQHLIMFVLDRRFRRLGRLARQRVSELTDPREKLHALLTTEVFTMRASSPAFRRDVAGNPAVRELVHAHNRIGVKMMAGVLEEGMKSGVFRRVDASFVAEMIDAMVSRLYEPEMDDNEHVEHLDFAARALEMAALIEAGVRA